MTRRHAQDRNYWRREERARTSKLRQATVKNMRAYLKELYSAFNGVEDFRTGNVSYSIATILILICVGLLMGENDIKNIEELLINKRGKVRKLLGPAFNNVTVSDTTMLRILHSADWIDILAVANEWIEHMFPTVLNEHYAVDGKAVRAALRKCFGEQQCPYILNAGSATCGCIRAQIPVGPKTNELGEFTNLLSLMPLENAVITIDAAGTNARVMNAIIQAGGHAILPVKGNQSNLQSLLEGYYNLVLASHPDWIQHYSSEDNGILQHGRIEYREHDVISEGIDDLLKGTRFEGIVHSVGRVERSRMIVQYDENHNRIDTQPESQVLFYITDLKNLSPSNFAKYIRDHWAGCEIIHYTLDCEFDEDLSTIRTGNGMTNLSILRKVVYALLKWVKDNSLLLNSFHATRMAIRDYTVLDQSSSEDTTNSA